MRLSVSVTDYGYPAVERIEQLAGAVLPVNTIPFATPG